MKSLMYEQLRHSEVILFNRCNLDTNKLYLRNNIKAFKITEIIQNVLCRHNGIKLEINNIDKRENP